MSITTMTATPNRTLSTRATTLYATLTAISFSATSSAPTPLYHIYQQAMALTPLTITVVFASYAFAMLAAFLTVAALSDYVGRRPMILAALALNALALVFFIAANSAVLLILARVTQGLATGIAMTTLGAAILDTDKANGPTLNSVTALLGLTAGSLLAGALVAWAPLPGQLVFAVLLAVTLIEALVLIVVPETATPRPGALHALKPHAAVPAAARLPLLRLLPLNIAGWALGGLYLSLMPTLVALVTHITMPFVGAAVVSALPLTAAISVFVLRHRTPAQLVGIANLFLGLGIAITLAGTAAGQALVLLAGTIVAGVGFGSAYSGNLRTLLPLAGPHERAGLLATYFIISYVAFSVPAIIAGLSAPAIGLVATVYIYGGALIGFVALSALATALANRTAQAPRLG